MKNLYLHIGIEKTGSTSIQNTFASNREYLKSIGIDYPDCFLLSNHVELACIAQNYNSSSELYSVVGFLGEENTINDRISRFKKKLRDYVKNSNCEDFVFSNEHLHSRIKSSAEIERLSEFLYEIFDRVTIVVYFREQLELAISHYSTAVKGGEIRDFFIPDVSDEIPYYYDFQKIIDNWNVFDGLVIREFDRNKLIGGDVVQDFSSLITEKNLEMISMPESNGSLGASTIELLKAINLNIPFMKNGRLNPARFRLVYFLEKLADNSPIVVNERDAIAFREHFKSMNKNIAVKFGLPENFLKKNYKINGSSEVDFKKTISNFCVEVSNHIEFIEVNNLKLKARVAMLESGEAAARDILKNASENGLSIDVDRVINEFKS